MQDRAPSEEFFECYEECCECEIEKPSHTDTIRAAAADVALTQTLVVTSVACAYLVARFFLP